MTGTHRWKRIQWLSLHEGTEVQLSTHSYYSSDLSPAVTRCDPWLRLRSPVVTGLMHLMPLQLHPPLPFPLLAHLSHPLATHPSSSTSSTLSVIYLLTHSTFCFHVTSPPSAPSTLPHAVSPGTPSLPLSSFTLSLPLSSLSIPADPIPLPFTDYKLLQSQLSPTLSHYLPSHSPTTLSSHVSALPHSNSRLQVNQIFPLLNFPPPPFSPIYSLLHLPTPTQTSNVI